MEAPSTKPTTANPAYARVADKLRAMILEGTVAPGERLPVEGRLAELFSVSRSTVREALRALASEHLVTTTRGVTGGTFVRHPDPDAISGSLTTGLDFLTIATELTANELLEAREILELQAVRLAAERRTTADLELLALCLASTGDVGREHRFEGNKSFHDALMDATGNRVLTVMARPLYSVLRDRFLRDTAPKSFWKLVEQDHNAIYEAIAASDPEAAAEAMIEHFVRLRIAYAALRPTNSP